MSRQDDLEHSILESYGIVREYEAMVRTSDRAEERLRARRVIGEQWALIETYLGEYQGLLSRLGREMPPGIAQIVLSQEALQEEPPSPAGRAVHPGVRRSDEARLQALIEDYQAASEQRSQTLDAVHRKRLERQMQSLEREIDALERSLGLRQPDAPSEAAGSRAGQAGALGEPPAPASGSAAPGASAPLDVASARKLLDRLDDPELDALCMAHFVRVYDKFGYGMRKDVKINLLLDYCRRVPGRLQDLAIALEEYLA